MGPVLKEFVSHGWTTPIVIGGTGGSGTRLVARLLREMGVELGTRVNSAEDALSFVPLYDSYIDDYLQSRALETSRFEADLLQAICDHIAPAGKAAWGWKNPRSIYLLPIFDSVIPNFKFVHVIRHGLDMAISANQNQLERHGRVVLGAGCDRLPSDMRSAMLWKRVNEAAAEYGCSMPGRYFLLRYEDVCSDPAASLAPLAAALGLGMPTGGWKEAVTPVAHRWQTLAPAALAGLRSRIGDALERFGYAC